MRKTESQKIALCGVLSALSVVVLLVGNVLQIGTYAAPMLASFLLIPVLEDYGKKYALLLYAVVSLLSLFLVPDKELVLFYVLVLGCCKHSRFLYLRFFPQARLPYHQHGFRGIASVLVRWR